MTTLAEVEAAVVTLQPEENARRGSLLDFLEGCIGLVADEANSPAESRHFEECGLKFTEGHL